MILANLTKAIREQNYYAVVLEFLIVIAGVVIGFQITAWNEDRRALTSLDNRLMAVRLEMTENLERVDEFQIFQDTLMEDLIELRTAIDDNDSILSDDDVSRLLMSTIPIGTLEMKSDAISALLGADEFTLLDNVSLIDAIENWDAALVGLRRVQRDALYYRDAYVFPTISDELYFTPMIQHYPLGEYVPPNESVNTFASISDNRRVENIVSIRMTYIGQDRERSTVLAEATIRLINRINDQLGDMSETGLLQ